MVKKNTGYLFLLLLACGLGPKGEAGILLSGSAQWGIFAFRPIDERQNVPNYYGLGGGVVAGYSLFQAIDAAVFIDYIAGNRSRLHPSEQDASLVQYGGQLGLRLEDKLFFALKGGQGVYHLVAKDYIFEEVTGIWQGKAGAFVMGAIYKIDKRRYWQLSLELMHVVLDKIQLIEGEIRPGKRKVDAFKVVVSYTFNSFVNHLSRGSFLKNVF